MRILGSIVLLVLGLYGAGIGTMAYFQRRLIYPGAYWAMGGMPATLPAGIEQVSIPTPDGETLHGLWLPPKPGCGVVLTFHGNASRPEAAAARFASNPWREKGWGVLAIAYRGYPGSTGTPSEEGLIKDGFAAHAFIGEKAPDASILLHGHSLGAAIAVAVAEQEHHLGLYLEAPFDSMSHTAQLHYPFVPSSLLLLDTYRSDNRITASMQPVMIVAGDRDGIVPASLSEDLAKAAGARATVETVPGGDHVSILGLRDEKAEPFFRKLACAGCGRATAGH